MYYAYMSNTSILQVRLSPKLKAAAEKRAAELGLSSVQEAIRMFLASFAIRELDISIVRGKSQPITLSAESKKKYQAIEKDIKKGENIYQASGVNDLLDSLYGHKDPVPQDVS
jgi:antitoxin component of RelBE/YafQ-DinJ toxin-antitoxin module